MREINVLSKRKFTKEDNPIFLLKSMKHEYLENTIKYGRFCFNHPNIFNRWEDQESAQYDKWDAHSAYAITRIVVNPQKDETTGVPIIDSGIQYKAEGEMHFQNDYVKHTPICCFRCIRIKDVEVGHNDEVYFTLGDIAERIEKEFGHDSYLIVPARPFLELFAKKVQGFSAMEVLYQDTLNDYPFLPLRKPTREILEQLFRKDNKYAWQKEYRIVLSPTNNSPVFKAIGSIEDMAVYGKIGELKDKKCIYHLNQDN